MQFFEKIKGGDRSFMSAVYKEHKARVYSICAMLLCDSAAAERASAHIFKRLWEDIPSEIGQSELGDYLSLRALAVCKSRLTKKNADALKLRESDISRLHALTESDIRADAEDGVAIFSTLPPVYRFAAVASLALGCSDAEIASSLKTTERIARALIEAAGERIISAYALVSSLEGKEGTASTDAAEIIRMVSPTAPSSLDRTVNEQIDAVAALGKAAKAAKAGEPKKGPKITDFSVGRMDHQHRHDEEAARIPEGYTIDLRMTGPKVPW